MWAVLSVKLAQAIAAMPGAKWHICHLRNTLPKRSLNYFAVGRRVTLWRCGLWRVACDVLSGVRSYPAEYSAGAEQALDHACTYTRCSAEQLQSTLHQSHSHRRRNHGCSVQWVHLHPNIQPVGADNVFCTHNILGQKYPIHHRITDD